MRKITDKKEETFQLGGGRGSPPKEKGAAHAFHCKTLGAFYGLRLARKKFEIGDSEGLPYLFPRGIVSLCSGGRVSRLVERLGEEGERGEGL